MQNPSNQVSYPLLRKGHSLSIVKVPDEFTIRTQRGVDDVELSMEMGCVYKEGLNKQNLSVLAVDITERDTIMDRIRGAEEVDFASHVYALENDPVARIYLTDELTIQFTAETDNESIDELINQHGLNYVNAISGIVNCHVFRLTSAAKINPLKLARQLTDLASVIYAEANVGIKSIHYHTPSDTHFGMQWHLFHNNGIQLASESHINAPDAWDITRGARSITVAVADDSVDLDHSDFQGEGKIVAPRDFQGFDFNPSPEASSDNHGTSCAGVAVAEENGSGVVGIAPACSLMPIRTSGILDDNSIEDIFDWAVEKGAAVISNSWGPGSVNFPLSIRQEQALRRAATNGRNGKGCVICFAAGNANRPVNGEINERNWPNGALSGNVKWYNGYAAHPEVITVAACTSLNRKSAYSSWGKEISVCAPSNNAHPVFGRSYTYPEVGGSFPGRGIVTTDRVGPLGYSSSDYTSNFGGTSSACPLVAGVAALVLSANPDLTAREVREILEQTADKIEDTSTDPQLGLALGTYDQNGHSQWFGYGKVNAYKAVREAINRLENPIEDTNEIKVETTPALSIPDNDEAGIVSTLAIEENGLLKGIEVKLKITHSYIGDLLIELQSPDGTRITLHNRKGGSSNDIDAVYEMENTSVLGGLIGENIRGEWKLFVKDLAAQDKGKLEFWSLRLSKNASGDSIRLEEKPGITIPDAKPEGLIRTLNNVKEGTIQEISIGLDISHTYISDLIVMLLAPSGQSITLHDRYGGSDDNIKTTYDIDNFPLLGQLLGQPAKGNWQLQIKDLAAQDIGKLNSWTINIRVE